VSGATRPAGAGDAGLDLQADPPRAAPARRGTWAALSGIVPRGHPLSHGEIMKPFHVALATLPLALCACSKKAPAPQAALEPETTAVALAMPPALPDLPTAAPAAATTADDSRPSAEEVAAFHAPVPK
jgi:hypothetical protein